MFETNAQALLAVDRQSVSATILRPCAPETLRQGGVSETVNDRGCAGHHGRQRKPRSDRVFTGAISQAATELGHLRAEFDAFRAASAEVCGASVQVGQTAARVCERAARISADSKRLRGELFRVRLPRDETCGAVARRLIEEHLDGHPAEIDAAKTVVSELTNNAFAHGDGTIHLWVSRRSGRVRVEVRDGGTGAVVRPVTDDRLHGLDIVDALSLSWGAREGSTHVWAELPTGAPPPSFRRRRRAEHRE